MDNLDVNWAIYEVRTTRYGSIQTRPGCKAPVQNADSSTESTFVPIELRDLRQVPVAA